MCVDLMSHEIFPPEKELIVYSSVFPDAEYTATSMTKRQVICLLGLLVITFILPVFWRRQGALTPWSHRHRSRDLLLLEKLAVHDIKRFPLVRRSSCPNATFIMQNYIATLCQQNLSRRYAKVLIRNDCLPSLCSLAAVVEKHPRGSSANSAGH
ncbi:Uncharacterized protein APZ42_020039 [Daphnia magna]|uniref:Uncharacterized protein n=1 Tax=Daphnia magna TaxID=35525 RepID=A0A164XXT0_9CRUS|nr:Uncharacterized protein APZ42_020039 [Daphnia magna]